MSAMVQIGTPPVLPVIHSLERDLVVQRVGVVLHLQYHPREAVRPLLRHVDPAGQLVPVEVHMVGPQQSACAQSYSSRGQTHTHTHMNEIS